MCEVAIEMAAQGAVIVSMKSLRPVRPTPPRTAGKSGMKRKAKFAALGCLRAADVVLPQLF
jgi:hypothetical protein